MIAIIYKGRQQSRHATQAAAAKAIGTSQKSVSHAIKQGTPIYGYTLCTTPETLIQATHPELPTRIYLTVAAAMQGEKLSAAKLRRRLRAKHQPPGRRYKQLSTIHGFTGCLLTGYNLRFF